MKESELIEALQARYPELQQMTVDGNVFFFTQPGQMMPFATLMTNDVNDPDSDLSREGVYRLNVGLTKAQFMALVPDPETSFDYTALDQLMPHPVYAKQRWVCVLNPGAETLTQLWPLLDEAWQRAARPRAAKS